MQIHEIFNLFDVDRSGSMNQVELRLAMRGLGFDEVMILGGLYSAVVIVIEVPTGAFADRLGRRRKTCRDCKKRRAGALVGAAFQNRCQNKLATKGLTIDDLNNFRYAGGDGGRKGLLANSRHLKYFRMCRGTPDGGLEDLPDHSQHCDICDHTIVENCYGATSSCKEHF